MILRHNYFTTPMTDNDFLPPEVNPIITDSTNIGRDAPQQLAVMITRSMNMKISLLGSQSTLGGVRLPRTLYIALPFTLYVSRFIVDHCSLHHKPLLLAV
jgi:hypothetical protein